MIKSKRGGYKGRLLLVITIILISIWFVSALNESSTTEIGILPVEETAASTEASISIMPTEPPTQEIPSESPSSAAISIQPIPSNENQNVPVEELIVTVPEIPVEVPPVQGEVVVPPSLLSTFLNLVLDKVKYFVGEVIEIKATLTDQNSNPIPDKKIDFYADEKIIGSNMTDIEGTAKVGWNTSSWMPGAYIIKADYAGDEGRGPISKNANVALIGLNNPNATIPTNVSTSSTLEEDFTIENKMLNEFDSKVFENLDNYLKSFVNGEDLKNNFRLKKIFTRTNKRGDKENVFVYQFLMWKVFPDGLKMVAHYHFEIKTDEFGAIKDTASPKQRYEFLKVRGLK